MSNKQEVRIRFKVQQYQTDAVNSTCDVFEGQPKTNDTTYRIDIGKVQDGAFNPNNEVGYKNANIQLTPKEILKNIQTIQQLNGIPESKQLASGVAPINLDVEMETGTGKTYVYIKTMLELNRRYGWNKFIIVVPSIAIREGVAENFTLLEDHFFEQYNKKVRWFVYDSDRLTDIQTYSEDGNVNCMIINSQAFASSMKEGASNKAALKIYSEQDSFQSRFPIDVIAANHPIVMLDEPQRLGGNATQKGIKRFNPLFAINYSATHKVKHNCIYALDALDAFNQRLVKRINAIGHKVENPVPAAYIAVKEIKSTKKGIKVKLETLKRLAGPKKIITFLVKDYEINDSLEKETKLPAIYEGYQVLDISPESQTVRFLNDTILHVGDVIGDENYRSDIQRSQIRNTINAHLEKEHELFRRGIKCISLIFIDFVSNYRSYDTNGKPQNGPLVNIFEEEYSKLVEDKLKESDEEYKEYLTQFSAQTTHTGYFSIDKNKRAVNTASDKEGDSDDSEAYDRILKDKGWLLSMSKDSPRFIFSHSALREGWDNPNVFQICMLRNSTNETSRRQEVGRGLRVCVDKNGVRQDSELLGDDFFEVNELTVIANEDFENFAKGIQDEILLNLRDRPVKLDTEYLRQFIGKHLRTDNGGKREIVEQDVISLRGYLIDNDYVDSKDEPTVEYRKASADNQLEPLPKKIRDLTSSFKRIVDAVFDKEALAKLINDITNRKTSNINQLNSNFTSSEFQSLWNEINHRYVYTVHYNSNELVGKSIEVLNEKLSVPKPRIITQVGKQVRSENGKLVFEMVSSEPTEHYGNRDLGNPGATYDLVGRIAAMTKLTRATIVKILKGLNPAKLEMFSFNPELFITQVSHLILSQKATMIVNHIQYDSTERTFDSSIFTLKPKADIKKALKANRHISDYVFYESDKELEFAKKLEEANEVVVYAKLPKSFKIPTPVGNYSPDWAIALENQGIKHIYFIAETKGSMESLQLKGIEKAKIKCADKLFNIYSTQKVRYEAVDSFDMFRDILDEYFSTLKE